MGDQGYNRKEFLYRIGTFFFLVGTGLFVFFMLSEANGEPVFNYFCWSTILLVIGFIFRAQYRKPSPPPSGRFSVFKRFKRQPKEEKK